MLGDRKRTQLFFEQLCVDYYEKVLHYLYGALSDETAARDCTQEVFLTACQKSELLRQHPNPGGFLFQTAKNLACKTRRESFSRMLRELSADGEADEIVDSNAQIETALDKQINELDYIESVLSQLTDEKRKLYSLYYVNKKSMSEIADLLKLEETAVRMRYVRLRREIREIAAEVSKQYFCS